MPRPRAVLFDRDDTLIDDVPYNGDPNLVVVRPGARLALDILRSVGMLTAVVSNQSAVGRGIITIEQVHAVNRRVESLLGPLGPWHICPHAPEARCTCRKPAPGLILQAAESLGVHPSECVVVGDKPSDVEAARAAGAAAILVSSDGNRCPQFCAVAANLLEAVELILGERVHQEP